MALLNENLSLSDYYKGLSELQTILRDRIIEKLEFKSPKTFYNKLNADSWSTIEREAIQKIIDDFNSELGNI
jgi:hypothetical protein